MIREHGSITVEDYMERCNAHYYGTRDPLGTEGDFVTAPEVSQMFGEMVGAALADCWLRAGAPANAIYVELGPGRGTLSADACRVLGNAGFDGEVHLVETSPALREKQRAAVPAAQFHVDMETLPAYAPVLLVANEFFDALPVQQYVGDVERRIVIGPNGLAFDSDGIVVERSPARSAYAGRLAARVTRNGGTALIIDYGHARSGPGDTLQAVRMHSFADPLAAPGEQDLTAHVDFEALADSAVQNGVTVSPLVSQGEWLERLGIRHRASALSSANPNQADAIEAALARLCDVDQMGTSFKVLALTARGWPSPAGFAQ